MQRGRGKPEAGMARQSWSNSPGGQGAACEIKGWRSRAGGEKGMREGTGCRVDVTWRESESGRQGLGREEAREARRGSGLWGLREPPGQGDPGLSVGVGKFVVMEWEEKGELRWNKDFDNLPAHPGPYLLVSL